MNTKALLSLAIAIVALAVAGSAAAHGEPPPPPPAPVEQPPPPPPPVRAPCECADLDVHIKSVGFEDFVQTHANVPARHRAKYIYKRYRIKAVLKLTCTNGDPSKCDATSKAGAPTGPPNWAVTGTSSTRTVKCRSKDCKGNSQNYEMNLGIRLDYIQDNASFVVDIPFTLVCSNTTTVKTLSLMFTNGRFDPSGSDLG